MSQNPKISIRGLTKVFYKKQHSVMALENISLDINEGEFVCFVGPSGCGKTTLLRILAGLESQSSGGFTIKKSGQQRPSQSMVFQEKGVFPWMTVAENIAFGLNMRQLPQSYVKERTNYFLVKTGLSKFADMYPKELSGGMKQRVSIARAFANDPEILLMDEPFGALDEQNRFILQEELLSIWTETKKTILFITHSIDEALYLSDRVVLMSAQPGKIVDEVEIKLPRPRKLHDIRSHPEMTVAFLQIWRHLQGEVQNARQEDERRM